MIQRSEDDAAASTQVNAGLTIGVLFIVALMISVLVAQPTAQGVDVGDRAPALRGDLHPVGGGGTWEAFDLSTHINLTWTDADVDQPFIMIEFMDTDCPHCWDTAGEMNDYYNCYHPEGPRWSTGDGYGQICPRTELGRSMLMYVVAVDLSSDDATASREEIRAFQERTATTGDQLCYNSQRSCADRPGDVHRFPYIEDLDMEIAGAWDTDTTPMYYILDPSGTVVLNSAQLSRAAYDDGLYDEIRSLLEVGGLD